MAQLPGFLSFQCSVEDRLSKFAFFISGFLAPVINLLLILGEATFTLQLFWNLCFYIFELWWIYCRKMPQTYLCTTNVDTSWNSIWNWARAQSRCNRGCLSPISYMDFQFFAIWAAQGSTEKKVWPDYEQLLRAVFLYFHRQIFVKDILKWVSHTVAQAINHTPKI